MADELGVFHVLLNGCLQLHVPGLVQLYTGEEVVDEREEERLVLVHQLGEVHVSENTHHDRLFRVVRRLTLHRSQRPQHGQDVTQAEIVVDL